jgi:hypothetical protein
MRKILIVLTVALTAAAAAATIPSASASTKCRPGTRLIVCSSTVSVCCPNGAECLCPPPES